MGNALAKLTRQNASDDSILVNEPDSAMNPPPNDQDDLSTPFSDIAMEYDEPYELLNDGSRRKAGGNREKQCKTCREWIGLGNVEAGENALKNHEGKRRCLASVAKAALEDLRRSETISLSTPYHHRKFTASPYSPMLALSFVAVERHQFTIYVSISVNFLTVTNVGFENRVGLYI